MVPIIFLIAFSILATTGAQLCFKKAVLGLGELNFSFSNVFGLIWQIVHNFWMMLGMILFGLSFLAWIFIISKLQLNIVYPIVIASQVSLIAMGSWLLFKECLSFWQILGIVVIAFGIFLLLIKS